MINEGATWNDINKWDPGFCMRESRKIKEYIGNVAMEKKKTTSNPKSWRPIVNVEQLKGKSKELAKWVNENFGYLAKNEPKPRKSPQLWLYGPTNTGKTTFCEWVKNYFRVYLFPDTEDWFDDFSDEAYDIILCDEFGANVPIQVMNKIAGGEPIKLKKKGMPSEAKVKNHPLILTTNDTPDELYHNVKRDREARHDAFIGRFKIIELTKDDHIGKWIEQWLFTWVREDVDHPDDVPATQPKDIPPGNLQQFLDSLEKDLATPSPNPSPPPAPKKARLTIRRTPKSPVANLDTNKWENPIFVDSDDDEPMSPQAPADTRFDSLWETDFRANAGVYERDGPGDLNISKEKIEKIIETGAHNKSAKDLKPRGATLSQIIETKGKKNLEERRVKRKTK
jgi:hypothetical protein